MCNNYVFLPPSSTLHFCFVLNKIPIISPAFLAESLESRTQTVHTSRCRAALHQSDFTTIHCSRGSEIIGQSRWIFLPPQGEQSSVIGQCFYSNLTTYCRIGLNHTFELAGEIRRTLCESQLDDSFSLSFADGVCWDLVRSLLFFRRVKISLARGTAAWRFTKADRTSLLARRHSCETRFVAAASILRVPFPSAICRRLRAGFRAGNSLFFRRSLCVRRSIDKGGITTFPGMHTIKCYITGLFRGHCTIPELPRKLCQMCSLYCVYDNSVKPASRRLGRRGISLRSGRRGALR